MVYIFMESKTAKGTHRRTESFQPNYDILTPLSLHPGYVTIKIHSDERKKFPEDLY